MKIVENSGASINYVSQIAGRGQCFLRNSVFSKEFVGICVMKGGNLEKSLRNIWGPPNRNFCWKFSNFPRFQKQIRSHPHTPSKSSLISWTTHNSKRHFYSSIVRLLCRNSLFHEIEIQIKIKIVFVKMLENLKKIIRKFFNCLIINTF